MNRRHFLTKSSLAMLAAAGLPKAVFNKPYSPTIYKTKLSDGISKQTQYELAIDHYCMNGLAKATLQEKTIGLKVSFFETTDFSKPTKSVELTYIVQESTLLDEKENLWKIKTKFDKKVSGDYKLPKEFPKDLSLTGKTYSYFTILDRKGGELVSIPYVSNGTDNEYDGCFLTTACVEHRQLADDCDELTTLRFLRDNYMKQDAEGIALVDNYKIIGPKIVSRINSFENKTAIYNYLYDHLIQPSVKLIKAKQYAEATAYYKDFVRELMQEYL
ncbi:hypothetical protein LK994_08705 [Ferruginibacter lapsinanis]|uniref:hypothetical protein n=1 Tax=Ferruginibacter lapsinanis TaxID=563172 RepID=UPI001E3E3D4F|nr:hypothetical protein [Ferruginibacter lapsinanis]UEG48715.1 hypothetical protein LK994_08705 [Ferruginibacter lapsinanis]